MFVLSARKKGVNAVMDWLKDFVQKFKGTDIQNLKSKKVKGSLLINFAGGEVKSCQLKQCVEVNKKEGE